MPECLTIFLCSDGLECCALRWGINDMGEYLDGLPADKVEANEPVREMYNWLVSEYNAYASGERECSRCKEKPDA